ncbi:MAG TPA: hypothetical protein VGK97_04195, partial [Spongiibacteraceae bacterium]
ILGLGFFAYRVIMGGGKSKVLEETDDDNDDDIDAVKGGKDSKDRKKDDVKDRGDKNKRASKAALDLPDDAIDLEPPDKKKK